MRAPLLADSGPRAWVFADPGTRGHEGLERADPARRSGSLAGVGFPPMAVLGPSMTSKPCLSGHDSSRVRTTGACARAMGPPRLRPVRRAGSALHRPWWAPRLATQTSSRRRMLDPSALKQAAHQEAGPSALLPPPTTPLPSRTKQAGPSASLPLRPSRSLRAPRSGAHHGRRGADPARRTGRRRGGPMVRAQAPARPSFAGRSMPFETCLHRHAGAEHGHGGEPDAREGPAAPRRVRPLQTFRGPASPLHRKPRVPAPPQAPRPRSTASPASPLHREPRVPLQRERALRPAPLKRARPSARAPHECAARAPRTPAHRPAPRAASPPASTPAAPPRR